MAQFIDAFSGYVARVSDVLFAIEDRAPSEHVLYYLCGISGPKRKDTADIDAIFLVHICFNIAESVPILEQW